jgi:hypothetical protein
MVILTVIAGIGLLFFSSCTEPVTPETGDMLNSVMDYIKANHTDAAPFIKEDMKWTEAGSAKRPGFTGVTYSAGGWTVAIGHAVTAEVIYDVRAEYRGGKILWVGTIKDSVITEESYTGD